MNDEFRNQNDELSPNVESRTPTIPALRSFLIRTSPWIRHSFFVIRSSFGFRHSDFTTRLAHRVGVPAAYARYSTFALPLLFADRGALLRDMGSGFRGDRPRVDATEVAMVIAATIAAVVAFWLLARFASFREGRGSSNNPKLLFRQLCQAHGLSRTQRSLLQQIGDRAEVAPPPAIFLRPELVDAALKDPQFEQFRGDLAALRRRLFAAA